jgi:hypothetical protein
LSSPKKEEISSTETSVHILTTWCYIPGGGNVHMYRCENLRSYKVGSVERVAVSFAKSVPWLMQGQKLVPRGRGTALVAHQRAWKNTGLKTGRKAFYPLLLALCNPTQHSDSLIPAADHGIPNFLWAQRFVTVSTNSRRFTLSYESSSHSYVWP